MSYKKQKIRTNARLVIPTWINKRCILPSSLDIPSGEDAGHGFSSNSNTRPTCLVRYLYERLFLIQQLHMQHISTHKLIYTLTHVSMSHDSKYIRFVCMHVYTYILSYVYVYMINHTFLFRSLGLKGGGMGSSCSRKENKCKENNQEESKSIDLHFMRLCFELLIFYICTTGEV